MMYSPVLAVLTPTRLGAGALQATGSAARQARRPYRRHSRHEISASTLFTAVRALCAGGRAFERGDPMRAALPRAIARRPPLFCDIPSRVYRRRATERCYAYTTIGSSATMQFSGQFSG